MNKRVLLIECEVATAALIQSALVNSRNSTFTVEWVTTLSLGLEWLQKGRADAILLNLSLPDSQGMETFDKLYLVASHIPILIVSDVDQENIAQQAIQHGAQDYFLKAHLNSYSLPQVLRNVIACTIADETLFIETHAQRFEQRQLGRMSLDQISPAAEDIHPCARGHVPPAAIIPGTPRRGHRQLDVSCYSAGHFGHGGSVRRVCNAEQRATARAAALPVDHQPGLDLQRTRHRAPPGMVGRRGVGHGKLSVIQRFGITS